VSRFRQSATVEPPIRTALPLIEKTYIDGDPPDLSKLNDAELQQVKEALQALRFPYG